MLKINRYTVDYIEDDIVKATATIFWYKLPTFNNSKPLKQVFITDVESIEKGCGFKLMTEIIDHFKAELSKKTRNGYCRDLLWLKVDKDNARAISLYKRVGFIEMHHVDNWIWMSMCLIVR
jgi:GNAT superfamily N-acetyltransferase